MAAGGLVFSSDDEPGIRRRGRTRFSYLDDVSGSVVRDRRTLDRIDALVIPPAWTEVWICRDEHGHLQATGRDARERKQYRYHAEYRRQREREKFADLIPFGEALGPVRSRLESDLATSAWDLDHVVALVLVLLDETLVRIGNEPYARDNGTFGLTTLRNRHLRAEGRTVSLHFVGKGGKEHHVAIDDPALARQVRHCRQLPGQMLFQWVDATGERHPVRSGDVNDRLRQLTGLDVTAKTFRTWGASVQAAAMLASAGVPADDREAHQEIVATVDDVAAELGNTRAVARSSYVHPAVLAAYEHGRLDDWWHDGPTRAAKGLEPDERRLLVVLRKARRAGLGVTRSGARRAA